MPELSVVTDPNLPEPKDISTASSGEVYVATGSGSGDWSIIQLQGSEYIADGTGAQSLTNGSFVDLSNDGNGSDTNTTNLLNSRSTAWDVSNNEFNWSSGGFEVGDVLNIRLDLTVNTSTANNEVAVRLDMAHGDAAEYPIELSRMDIQNVGATNVHVNAIVSIKDTDVLNNPAKLSMYVDAASASVVFNDMEIITIPKNPVFV